MLSDNINGPQKKSYPTVIKERFIISDLKSAELDNSKNSKQLYVCVNAFIETSFSSHINPNNQLTDEYLLTIPLSDAKDLYALNFDDVITGCKITTKADSDRLSVKTKEEFKLNNIPVPYGSHASIFSFKKQYNHGVAGTITLSDTKRLTSSLRYITNNKLNDNLSYTNIMVKTKKTVIPAKEEQPADFNSKDLLVVFYPFTVIWDIITAPFILLYMAVTGGH
jgi:hypothetical protein